MFWELSLYVQKDSRGKNIEDFIAISISLQKYCDDRNFYLLAQKWDVFQDRKKERDTKTFEQKNNTLVSGNAGDEKSLRLGDLKKKIYQFS